jgi:hypothetical protein
MFLLGDIGAVPGAPVTVCLGGPDCPGRYTLDPRTHTLAVRAAVRLRIGDLREETRTGQQAVLRVQVAPVPEGLTVLVVVRRPSHQFDSIWAARRVTLDTWEWGVLFTPVLSPDTELAVYLVGP